MDVRRLGLLRELAAARLGDRRRAAPCTSRRRPSRSSSRRWSGRPASPSPSGRGAASPSPCPGRMLAETAKDIAVAIEKRRGGLGRLRRAATRRGDGHRVPQRRADAAAGRAAPRGRRRRADRDLQRPGSAAARLRRPHPRPRHRRRRRARRAAAAGASAASSSPSCCASRSTSRCPRAIRSPARAELTPADVIGERWIGVPVGHAVRPHPAAHRGDHRPAGGRRAALHRQRHRRVDGRRPGTASRSCRASPRATTRTGWSPARWSACARSA